ncbi:uncharacterized protein CANTADRAFT_26764, partial [Suhomyces tanzawaensis NRRL Y-17324]
MIFALLLALNTPQRRQDLRAAEYRCFRCLRSRVQPWFNQEIYSVLVLILLKDKML